MKRIHIVGVSPRTGTTLLAELMISCFEIDLYEEHETRLFARPSREGAIFLTKRPRDVMVAGPRLWIDPDLWVICMVRDPRDIIVSRHGRDPDRYWAGLAFWKTYEPAARRLSRHPRCITIRYEDLVDDADSVQTLLMNRMPFLVRRGRFTEYHVLARPSHDSLQALGSLRPIDRSSMGVWRQHLPRVAGQLRIHGSISDDLIRYGYEANRDWEVLLEGIEPDLNASHQPERFSFGIRWKLRRGRYSEALRTLFRRCRRKIETAIFIRDR